MPGFDVEHFSCWHKHRARWGQRCRPSASCIELRTSIPVTLYSVWSCSSGDVLVMTWQLNMMTSSNGNIFRVTGHLCGEFTGDRWRGALMFSLICVWINGWVNNGEAGDLKHYRAHYDVIVMKEPGHQWAKNWPCPSLASCMSFAWERPKDLLHSH